LASKASDNADISCDSDKRLILSYCEDFGMVSTFETFCLHKFEKEGS
jgi:hypothetical protein